MALQVPKYAFTFVEPPSAVRLLDIDAAARYCGLRPSKFKSLCPVAPIHLDSRTSVWDVVQLDRWIDRLHGKVSNDAIDQAIRDLK